jgi:hypothetical protein
MLIAMADEMKGMLALLIYRDAGHCPGIGELFKLLFI